MNTHRYFLPLVTVWLVLTLILGEGSAQVTHAVSTLVLEEHLYLPLVVNYRPPPPPSLHLYPAYGADPAIFCHRVRAKVIYFVPQGQEAYIYAGWSAAAGRVFAASKTFYEREFSGYLELNTDILSTPVIGQKTTYTEVETRAEISATVFTPGGHYYDPVFAAPTPDEYTVWMVYFLDQGGAAGYGYFGGAYPVYRVAYNSWFWLEHEEQEGKTSSAHELGHLLGMPHPWEMTPPYPNDPANVMSWTDGSKTLMEMWVLPVVKQAMGMPAP